MLITKQTAHTHLFGWMQHAYTRRRLSINSKQKRNSKTRHMQKPEIPNACFANGASADYRGADEDDDSTGVKISGKYVGLLAALMDEVNPISLLYTLNPNSYTLNPVPDPYTLHPTPYTLHPTPFALISAFFRLTSPNV